MYGRRDLSFPLCAEGFALLFWLALLVYSYVFIDILCSGNVALLFISEFSDCDFLVLICA